MTERKVQQKALNYLNKKYRWRCFSGKLFSKTEVRTHRRFGGKRADGLLAFRHWLWGTYVVSLEAKSLKTLPAIRPYRDQWNFLYNCIKAGIIGLLLSGAYLALVKMDDGLIQFSLPFNTWVAFAVGYGIVTVNSFRHRTLPVVQQIKQYPANEQWLAFCSKSMAALSARKKKHLLEICKYQGIGILVVQASGKVRSLVKPKRRWRWQGDYLRYYSKGKQIRQSLYSTK